MATFQKIGGKSGSKSYLAGGTIAKDTIVQYDEAGAVVTHATNKSALGIALAAATSGQYVLVDHLYTDSEVLAKGVTPTVVAATVGDHVDVTAGADITFTATNSDALVIDWKGSATSAILTFKKIVFGSSTLS